MRFFLTFVIALLAFLALWTLLHLPLTPSLAAFCLGYAVASAVTFR